MDHNGFRRYLETVVREIPGVPLQEEAKLYHQDPERPWSKGAAPPLDELLTAMAEILNGAETELQGKQIKTRFRAILSVLASHYNIDSNGAMAQMQRRKVIT